MIILKKIMFDNDLIITINDSKIIFSKYFNFEKISACLKLITLYVFA